jgi:hypothetical protein
VEAEVEKDVAGQILVTVVGDDDRILTVVDKDLLGLV